jgi:cytochrome c peroxidase
MNKTIIFFSLFLLLGVQGQANEAPSLSLGKTLFESTQLGTRGKSCQTCHAKGKGLEMIGDFNDEELKDIINACLRDALGGQLISLESQEMLALHAYVRQFQK